MTVTLYQGDCLDCLPQIPSASVDAVITDPPYPMIKRPYGMLTEAEWWDLMMGVCAETRRILKPTGSAVFILQPNSRKVGSMRGWLWEFMAWVCREWNMVQDVWWWNTAALPLSGSNVLGTLRPSIKACIWAGVSDCYRNQDGVLWGESDSNIAARATRKARIEERPCGVTINSKRISDKAERRGGVTPFNVLPVANTNSVTSAGANGHGAGTPLELAKWWTRYIVPPGGVVCDPFMGSGTMGLAALHYGNSFIGIERMDAQGYFPTAQERLSKTQPQLELSACALPAR